MGACCGKAASPTQLPTLARASEQVAAHVETPDEVEPLISLLLDPTVSDEQLSAVVAKLVKLTQTSTQHRVLVSSPQALHRLATELVRSPAHVQATADLLRYVAACPSTHGALEEARVAPALVHQLSHAVHRVKSSCLGALRNLSTTPSAVLPHAGHPKFLAGLRAFLSQHADPHAQLCAAQLLLNICSHSDVLQHLPAKSAVALCIDVLTASPPADPPPDPEVHDMCCEALLSLVRASDACLTEFRTQGGLPAALQEAMRQDSLSSTRVFVCELLSTVVDEFGARELLRLHPSPAIARMFSTDSCPDDRVLHLDVKLAVLQLAGKLCLRDDVDADQQAALAREIVQQFDACLRSQSMPLQLAVCRLVQRFVAQRHTRAAVMAADIAPALVDVQLEPSSVASAAAFACVARLCELSQAHADAIVRYDGLTAMLDTLQNSKIAQAQRHALVAATAVLTHGTPSVLSPVLRGGTAASVAALVLCHTGVGKMQDQTQWVAWCCRLLACVAAVDDGCRARVVSVLAATDRDTLRLALRVPLTGGWDAAALVPVLAERSEAADDTFLGRVADSQRLAEAIALDLRGGRHQLLSRTSHEAKTEGSEPLPEGRPSAVSERVAKSLGVLTEFGSTYSRTIDTSVGRTMDTSASRTMDSTKFSLATVTETSLAGPSQRSAGTSHRAPTDIVAGLRMTEIEPAGNSPGVWQDQAASPVIGSPASSAAQSHAKRRDTRRSRRELTYQLSDAHIYDRTIRPGTPQEAPWQQYVGPPEDAGAVWRTPQSIPPTAPRRATAPDRRLPAAIALPLDDSAEPFEGEQRHATTVSGAHPSQDHPAWWLADEATAPTVGVVRVQPVKTSRDHPHDDSVEVIEAASHPNLPKQG